jgi:hypothetical protein
VACYSVSNCTVIYRSQWFVDRWNGRTWTLQTPRNQHGSLAQNGDVGNRLACPSPRVCIAVSRDANDNAYGLVLRF